jgi:hypothetical protein
MGADWACETLLFQSLHRATDIRDGFVEVLVEAESSGRLLNRILRREPTVPKNQTNCPVDHATEKAAEPPSARFRVGGVDDFL